MFKSHSNNCFNALKTNSLAAIKDFTAQSSFLPNDSKSFADKNRRRMSDFTFDSEMHIKSQVKAYIDQIGDNYPEWAIGISTKGDQVFHKLCSQFQEKSEPIILRTASSSEVAKNILRYFQNMGLTLSSLSQDDGKLIIAHKSLSTN